MISLESFDSLKDASTCLFIVPSFVPLNLSYAGSQNHLIQVLKT